MHLVHHDGIAGRDVDVVLRAADVTLAQVAAALHPAGAPHARVRVDGRLFEGAAPAVGHLRRGCVVHTGGDGPPVGAAVFPDGRPGGAIDSGAAVVSIGGVDSGRWATFQAGTVLVGRGESCDLRLTDPTVSRRHASIVVDGCGFEVRDLGSRNGTWVPPTGKVTAGPLGPGQVVRLGAAVVEVRQPPADHRTLPSPATGTGTVGWARPPRAAPPGPAVPLAVPVPPPSPAPPVPLSAVALLTPMAMAAAMVAITRSPLFLLMAAASPVAAVAGWLEGRRRAARTVRRQQARFDADLDRFEAELAAAATAAVVARRLAHPDPAEVVRRAVGPSRRLWERRRTDPDLLCLRLGMGNVPWSPPLARASCDVGEAAADRVAGVPWLRGAPVVVDLAGGGALGIVGDRQAARALARSLVVQAVTHAGPSDVAVAAVVSEQALPGWAWLKWLPHAYQGGDTAAPLLAEGAAAGERLLDALGRSDPGDTVPVLLLDDDDLLDGRPSVSRLVARDDGAATVVLAPTLDRLPAACRYVVSIDGDGHARLEDGGTDGAATAFGAAGMAVDVAALAARALARVHDPELASAGAGMPATVDLLGLLDLAPCTPAALARRWSRADPARALPVPLGVTAAGPFVVDLVADGPHALVAGTTGSGKSELLRTLVAGLAAGAHPDDLTFLLVDFKGGSAFDACARLPHTAGVVTDLDEHLAARALRCLEAELRRREGLLRAAGTDDVAAYRAHRRAANAEPLPRLVVVVDEFATLRAELPTFVDALVDVAQRGARWGCTWSWRRSDRRVRSARPSAPTPTCGSPCESRTRPTRSTSSACPARHCCPAPSRDGRWRGSVRARS